jgi:uncharacterized membrane protein
VQWLRRSFITGLVLIVPLVVTVTALVWVFSTIDGFMGPYYDQLIGREVPGLGLMTTVLLVLIVGAVGSNVIGRRVVQAAEGYLLRVPVFRTIYSPVRQLVAAFSPDNEYGLKRVVMIREPEGRYVLGFLTREFTLDRGQGVESLLAVYVPTNHLYLGDIHVVPADAVTYPDISVEEGIRIFLTGGMSLSARLRGRRGDDGVPGLRV